MNYKELLEKYRHMMEVAIWSMRTFDTHPLNGLEKENFIMYYENEKEDRLKIESGKYATLASLKHDIAGALIYFNEGSGEAVEQFWKKIYEEGLPFKRENKLKKILKRKRIANDIEYDFVIDVIGPYSQQGIITEEEIKLLNQYIGDFEMRGL